MRKVLVLSDSHGDLTNARRVLAKLSAQIEMVIHLGDHDFDAIMLQKEYPQLPFHYVRGNNDSGYDSPLSKVVRIAGKGIFVCHGHKQRVYWDLQNLIYGAEEEECQIALFGHTHRAFKQDIGGILALNPGSISVPRDGIVPTFAILMFDGERIEASIMECHGDSFRLRNA